MKPILFLTRRIPEPAIKRLEEKFTLKINPYNRALTHQELIEGVKDAEALICLLTDNIDKEVISAAPKLKVISSYAVGYNNIEVEYATQLGIAVCNTPGVLTETTADLTWALILATCRRISESERFLRKGNFKGWEPMLMLGLDVYGKTLGIIGMGRIGQAVAKRATGFAMRIIYYNDVPVSNTLPFETTETDLQTLLKEADIITLHLPLTKETFHLIGKEEFALMKENAVLINTSRGAVIDEKELIKALSEKRIFSAGLDVYENEPDIPQELLALENVVLLPHIGSASIETRTKMALLAAENAIAVMEGRKPPAQVN
ncbi:MAG: D-glycerate dehydrogenase [Candidatus Cloacimonadota bacterium]|jgi:glyoxylate reductase|nr:D-glycerate dehydrogenase [Candidatus Cloacimonas acidaminovorans]MDI9572451.1 D-glycerate dehydrogenase [Candidatus Cloacimonadota bacterium]HRS60399.1 D-glycerate dehydrogenase [Candidatus Cloacimonas sp.]HNV63134.1 D-glycerate dehydrogenase [Candidatus Cloacimonas acidaminovorans]HNZ89458.1 D-glycerate dehydrogenase [Candidatus Cloacimonas acidaminovorans]